MSDAWEREVSDTRESREALVHGVSDTWAREEPSPGTSGGTQDEAAPSPASDHERAIEAVLMVAIEPVAPGLLAELLEVPLPVVEEACRGLANRYEDERRGFVLTMVAGGYRFQSHPEMASYVERFASEGVSTRLSGAALETLAIIAYKQPVTRGQIAAIRGVNPDGVVRMLCQRGYIEECGHAPGPGQPALFATTDLFLEKLGLGSLSDLPPIADLVPGVELLDEMEAGFGRSAGALRSPPAQGSSTSSPDPFE